MTSLMLNHFRLHGHNPKLSINVVTKNCRVWLRIVKMAQFLFSVSIDILDYQEILKLNLRLLKHDFNLKLDNCKFVSDCWKNHFWYVTKPYFTKCDYRRQALTKPLACIYKCLNTRSYDTEITSLRIMDKTDPVLQNDCVVHKWVSQ